jgi:phosphosulfolactate phosphohydrolase-like enzyme
VVCAGNDGGQLFSLEDFAAAGAICRALRDVDPGIETGDAANLAMGLNTAAATAESQHAGLLRKLGLESDIVFAVQADTSQAVPLITACGPGWALLADGARQD